MINKHFIIIGSFLLATVFGIYGQGMAYFLNANIAKVPPIYYLTALTIASIILYIIYFILVAFHYRQQRLEDVNGVSFLYVTGCLIGLLTSCWSLFVLMMWWG